MQQNGLLDCANSCEFGYELCELSLNRPERSCLLLHSTPGAFETDGNNRDSLGVRCEDLCADCSEYVFRPYLNVAVIARNRDRPK